MPPVVSVPSVGYIGRGAHSRRVGVLIAMAAASCVLAACGGTTTGDGSSAGASGGALAAAPGFDPATSTITVAVLAPLTGPQASASVVAHAFKAYFDSRNATNPLAGKYKVNVDVQDTQYSASTAYTAFNAVKDKTVMIGQIVGHAEPLVPLLKLNNMVAVADSFQMNLLRAPNVIANGVPTELQAASGLDYAVNTLGAKDKKFCLLTQADDLGKSAVSGAQFAAPKLGITLGTQTTYVPTATDYSGQIQKLKSDGCQVVLFGGIPPAFIGSIVASSQLSFAPQWITTNTAVTAPGAFKAISEYLATNKVLFVGNGPAWTDTTVTGQRAMVAALAQYDSTDQPALTLASGWADAAYTAGILERAIAKGDLSHAGVLAAANSAGTLTSDGVYIGSLTTGAPAARQPLQTVTIFGYSAASPTGVAPVKQNYLPAIASGYPLPTS
jgi:branched-chain amino acid transport system substrate-binding protein